MSLKISSVTRFIARSNIRGRGEVDLWPLAQKVVPEILAEFYAGLRSTEEFRDTMASDAVVAQLSQAQSEHWRQLFQPHLAAGFEARSERVGKAHVRIGLPSGWYMAGYAFLLKKLIPFLARKYRFSPKALACSVDVLVERVFTDMILSSTVYEEKIAADRMKEAEEERNSKAFPTRPG